LLWRGSGCSEEPVYQDVRPVPVRVDSVRPYPVKPADAAIAVGAIR
jgi:hypothetical protein